jgi:hypothetical protein
LIGKLQNNQYSEVVLNVWNILQIRNKMERMTYKVFISYRREDMAFKDTVCKILGEYIDKDKIFVDTKNLYNKPNEWVASLHAALYSSEYIVVCINKYTFDRESKDGKTDWYYEEIETALKRQKTEGMIRIIPAINVRPDFNKSKFSELSKFQDVNYQSLGEEKFRENLLKMIGITNNQKKQVNVNQTIINNITNNIGSQYNFGDINGGTVNVGK